MRFIKLFFFYIFFCFLVAVQHERAPRPNLMSQHQISLHKLGYNFNRQGNMFPPMQPHIPYSTFPTFASYSVPTTPADPLGTSNFLETPFRDISQSRIPDSIPSDFSQLNPFLNSHVGPLSNFNPFKIPLLPTSLHYSFPYPGYFPANMFYPPVAPSNVATSAEFLKRK